jgi:hypothetical protein
MVIGASSATNAVLGTVQEWQKTFDKSPKVEMVEGVEEVATSSSPVESPAIPLWSWYILAAGAGVSIFVLARVQKKDKQREEEAGPTDK